MQAKFDNNKVPTLIGVLDSDGVTPTRLKANPSTHSISVDDDTGGSDLSGDNAKRDDNGQPTMLAVSSADGVTPVPLYINSNGELLINSN